MTISPKGRTTASTQSVPARRGGRGLALMLAAIVLGREAAGAGPTAASRPVSEKEKKAVSVWVESEKKRLRGGSPLDAPVEFLEGRIYVSGDVGEDGHDDLAVQYTIERGNRWDIHLVVLRRDNLRVIAHGRIGGKSFRSIEILAVENGLVTADSDNYEYDDPMCCPSVPGMVNFGVEGKVVEERDARFDCSEPAEELPDPSSRV